jgi:hypothetical protein
VSHWFSSKSTLTSSSTTSLTLVTLGDSCPRWLGVPYELPILWLSPRKSVLPSSSWGLVVKSQTWSKWLFGEGWEQHDPLWAPQWRHRHLCGAKLWEQIYVSCVLLWFTFKPLALIFHTLGFCMLLSEISCLYLAPEFLLLITCCSKSYVLSPSWIRTTIEFYRSIYFSVVLGQTSIWVPRLICLAGLVLL